MKTEILDMGGQVIATLDEEGEKEFIVRMKQDNRKLGYVGDDDRIYDEAGHPQGTVDGSGYVRRYIGNVYVGQIRNGSRVYDFNNHQVGTVRGEHIFKAGAALLLLVE